MIVMRIAITPSLNASSLVLDTVYPGRLGDGASAAKERPLAWLLSGRGCSGALGEATGQGGGGTGGWVSAFRRAGGGLAGAGGGGFGGGRGGGGRRRREPAVVGGGGRGPRRAGGAGQEQGHDGDGPQCGARRHRAVAGDDLQGGDEDEREAAEGAVDDEGDRVRGAEPRRGEDRRREHGVAAALR